MIKRIVFVGIIIFISTLTNPPSSLRNFNGHAHGFDKLNSLKENNIEGEELVIYLEEVQEPITGLGIDQLFSGTDSTEPSGEQKTEEKREKERQDVQQKTIKVRTQLKCVESVLRNAIIEPYFINGQIEGLQISNLDEISEAKNLLLKSNDVILAVNGQTLGSKKEAYDIFKKAMKEPIITVDLLHNREAKKLLFDFH
jgi:type II secretory pathway component PulC